MKKTILLLLLQLFTVSLFAQEDDEFEETTVSYKHNNDVCYRLTKEGAKVYVEANTEATEIHTQNLLDRWGFWEVVSSKKKADFIMRVKSKGGMSEYMAYAVLIDKQTGKVFYKTPLVNTFGRISFHGKKAVIKKVIRKIKHHLGVNDYEPGLE